MFYSLRRLYLKSKVFIAMSATIMFFIIDMKLLKKEISGEELPLQMNMADRKLSLGMFQIKYTVFDVNCNYNYLYMENEISNKKHFRSR